MDSNLLKFTLVLLTLSFFLSFSKSWEGTGEGKGKQPYEQYLFSLGWHFSSSDYWKEFKMMLAHKLFVKGDLFLKKKRNIFLNCQSNSNQPPTTTSPSKEKNFSLTISLVFQNRDQRWFILWFLFLDTQSFKITKIGKINFMSSSKKSVRLKFTKMHSKCTQRPLRHVSFLMFAQLWYFIPFYANI